LSIPLVFVEEKEKKGKVIISPSDAYHLKEVLRFREGDELYVSDGKRKFLATIISLSKGGGVAELVKEVKMPLQKGEILLFQALLKGKKMDFLVQKATELGVDYFYPTIFKRSVAKSRPQKLKRWKKIVKEACKQSGRHYLMEVNKPLSFSDALKVARDCEVLIAFSGKEKGANLSKVIKEGSRVALFFGPEGGFAGNELEEIKKYGGKIASLGPLILRAETATIAGVALASYFLGRNQFEGRS
jgi:16S rRNA (uracil1498-N3)-methyltransferase